MFDVFINYRTPDAKFGAAAAHALLAEFFGPERVFLDHQSMTPGGGYPQELRAALECAQVLVVLIGPGWLAGDPEAPRRLVDRPGDWVRREIRRALERDILIVPVLLDGTLLPTAEQLPEDIQALVYRQAAEVRHRTLREDVLRLGDRIVDAVPALLLPELFLPEPALPADPPPSLLLQPEYGVVEYAPFDGELDRLGSWLAGPGPADVRLVTGPGGQGKTRLAAELVKRARLGGWSAGFVADELAPRALRAVSGAAARLLLVVDYAEGRTDQLVSLGQAMVQRPPAAGAVRLLLLARSPGLWQRALQRVREPRVAMLYSRLAAEPLATLPAEETFRRAEFDRAVEAFRPYLPAHGGAEPAPPADLRDDGYDRVLDVHAAALAALLDGLAGMAGGGPAPAGQRIGDPLARVLDHEERYWFVSADGERLPEPHYARLRAVVCAATLFGAADAPAARPLLARLTTFDGAGTDLVERYRAWLSAMYPGPAALNPLRPDRLGEDLVVAALADDASLVAGLAAELSDGQVLRALTVLARAAQRHSGLGRHMSALLAADLATRVPLGMAVATQVDDPALVEALTEVTRAHEPDLAEVIVDRLPEGSLALAAFAVFHTKALLRRELQREPVDHGFVAEVRHNLAIRLTDAGEHDEALVTSGLAVAEYRRLARTDHTEEVELATALNTLAHCHARLGMYEDALSVATESVELLESALTRPAPPPDCTAAELRMLLATSLLTMANLLADTGDADQAASDAGRAVEIQRDLVDQADGDARTGFVAHLASGLEDLGSIQSTCTRYEDSLAACEEAVGLYRELDAAAPDRFRGELVRALGNLAGAHAEVHQWDTGARHGEEAVTAARAMVHRYGQIHLERLADTLNNTAALFRRLDRHERAHTYLVEAVQLYRQLAARLPGTQLEGLAAALHNLGNCLGELTRPREALDAYEESSEIYRKLSDPRPGVFDADLAEVLISLADLRSELDDDGEAFRLATEAVEILDRQLTAGRAALRRKLARALHILSLTAGSLGRTDLAASAAHRASALYQGLIGNLEYDATEHASVLHAAARATDLAGDHELAATLFDQTITLLRQLIAGTTSEGGPDAGELDELGDELAAVLLNAAVCNSTRGHDAAARDQLLEAVELRTALAGTGPDGRLRLAEARNNLADTLCDLGEHGPAMEAAAAAVELALAELDQHHPEALDVAVYALTTRARILGAADTAAAVADLATAWRLARRSSADELTGIVRATLADLGVARRTLRKLWRTATQDPYPEHDRQR